MAELKTRPTKASVGDYIGAIADPVQRKDAKKLASMMRTVTGQRGRMWGTSIVGFGTYRYANTAGQDFEWMSTNVFWKSWFRRRWRQCARVIRRTERSIVLEQ